MDSDVWPLICENFDRIREAPQSRHAALLAALDPALRAEVESLLTADRAAGVFLQTSQGAVLAPGERLGTYRILREVGSGGMGVVYLAERSDGEFRRHVAVKVTGDRLFAPEAERRFIRERQILAQLDHPNIVKLIDGGITRGRRYFVMEFVEGESITLYAKRIPLRERLRLFTDVCSAVHYAHQRLIIHRDLKPANVLVTGGGVAKLLDFGVAQVLDVSIEGDSRTALHPLSLACASPEQLRGEPLTVATDIYSLGILLYELLVGRNPQVDEGTPHVEVVRRVTEVEAPQPSVIVPSIPSDLNAITLKAISKRPQDRYPSVAELQADLERYLAGRPVMAVPPHAIYLASKFVRRNKALAGTAAAFVALLVVGGFFLYNQSRIDARRYAHASRLVRSIIFEVQPRLDGLPATVPVRKILLEQTIDYLEALAKDAGRNVALLRELSTSYLHMARLQGNSLSPNLGQPALAERYMDRAEELVLKALTYAPSDRLLIGDAAILYAERTELDVLSLRISQADSHSVKALDYAGRFVAFSPSDWEARRVLANAHYQRGSAISRSKEDQAIPFFARAREQFLQLHLENSSDPVVHRYTMLSEWRLAETYLAQGDIVAALPHAEAGLKVAEELLRKEPLSLRARLYVSSANIVLANVHFRSNDMAAAIHAAERGVEWREKILAQDPHNPQATERLAAAHRTLALPLLAVGDLRSARKSALRAVTLYSPLRKQGSLVPLLGLGLAESYLTLAHISSREGKQGETCTAAQDAMTLFLEFSKALGGRKSAERSVAEARELATSCQPGFVKR